jgi:hypothetical protein
MAQNDGQHDSITAKSSPLPVLAFLPGAGKGATPFQHDVDSDYDEEELPTTLESDYKRKQIFKGWTLFW